VLTDEEGLVEGLVRPDPRLGTEVGGYRIDSFLGRGGMSRVYRAEHGRLGRPVALKLLGPELADDPTFRARFEREWRIAAGLRHPHIVPIYDAGDADGVLYIAMLLVEGGDLSALLRDAGAMEPERALDVLAQIASALDAAHEQHLIHRDLKPSNILLATGQAAYGKDHAYLADFGLTKSVGSGSRLTMTGSFLGTPSYIAPEQVSGRPVDHRADIYALACVLFECLTGSVPYPRETEVAAIAAHLTDPLPSARSIRPDLPLAIDAVLARGLAKKPDDRFATASELIGAAKSAFAAGPAAAVPAATVALTAVDQTLAVRADPLEPAGTSPRSWLSEVVTNSRRRGEATVAEDDGEADSGATAVGVAMPRDEERRARRSDTMTPTERAPRRRGVARPALILGLVLIPLLVAGAVLAGFWPRFPGGVAATSPSPPTPAATASPTSATSPSPTGPAGLTAHERYLYERVPAAIAPGCRSYTPRSTDTEVQGQVAGLTCRVSSADVSEALYFRFTSSDVLTKWWRQRLREAHVQPDSGGCSADKSGETSYADGRVLCFVSSSAGRIRWLDENALIYGAVNGRLNGALSGALGWWAGMHRPENIRTEPLFLPAEQRLLDETLADIRDGCTPYRIVLPGEVAVEGSIASIDCAVTGTFIENVGYFRFASVSALETWWKKRIAREGLKLDSGGCADGTAGETAYEGGRMACYLGSDNKARIRWIDYARLVYGTLNANNGNLEALLERWGSLIP
jgi:serine/threonine protein kinase